LPLKGATWERVQAHFEEKGIEREKSDSDGAMAYQAAKFEMADSKLVWMAYRDEGTEKIVSQVTYELEKNLPTIEEVNSYISSMYERFGTPYNHIPLRINPKEKWQVFWALPQTDVRLEYLPEAGLRLVMAPVVDTVVKLQSSTEKVEE